jgi:Coenzyme PQQ synthesis protein D (PqqD)
MRSKYLARSSQIAARMLGGEMMIMSPLDSTFFTLNEVATVIWQAADGKTTLEEIVREHVVPVFDVDPAVARQDSEEFADELSRHGILLVSDHPISAVARPETFQ